MVSGLACAPAQGAPSSPGAAAKGASVSRPDDRPADRPIPAAGERLTRGERLQRRADFLKCYRQGRRRHSSLAVLHIVPNQLGHPRLGITASRKVGNSVIRHRMKRRTREVFRRWSERRNLPAVDIVVHLKPTSASSPFSRYRTELERMLRTLLPDRAS